MMKFQKLLLPVLISTLVACGGEDDQSTNVNNNNNSDQNSNQNTESNSDSNSNGELLDPSSKGELSEFSGAQRLKKERTAAIKASLSDRKVKHVILFIGDGTSESEITSARNYIHGAAGYFKGLDVLPFTGAYTTYSLNKDNTIDYATDSAASATAWATGVKTYNGALGIDIREKAHESILSLAKKAGFATGNVTTTELQDATPAALVSHVTSRRCYGPKATSGSCPSNAKERGGLGSITEQLLDARADVTLGGGKASFNEVAIAGDYKDQTLLAQAQKRGYQIVENATDLSNVDVANQNKPLLGLFANGNLEVSWSGPEAVIDGNKQPATQCFDNPKRSVNTPTLKAMTSKAIDLLKTNPKGFFLQVESGSIDKQNHAANACGQIGETLALDEAIQVALEFAKKNQDTLIIVTGDHAHTSQIIPTDSNSPGKTVSLLTKDRMPMTINYATSTGPSQEHTGAQVRTAAYGPRAGNISGLLDQTDVFFIMRDALGIQ